MKLESVSYYRLRAYTYPFQDNHNPAHPFVVDIGFDDIFDLYSFDHLLRSEVFNMLGIIEIAFRTQIIYQFSQEHGSHWQTDPALYRDPMKFANQLNSLQEEIRRSNEDFIDHYRKKYTDPNEPPSWMSLEVSSFGLLSKIFQNLAKGKAKINVAKYFGINDISIIENWLLCFSNVRNICAHHSRLWNRRLTAKPKLPYVTKYPFISNHDIYPNKIYATLCCMLYILKIIRPEMDYTAKIKTILMSCPMCELSEMGIPNNWEQEDFWK